MLKLVETVQSSHTEKETNLFHTHLTVVEYQFFEGGKSKKVNRSI